MKKLPIIYALIGWMITSVVPAVSIASAHDVGVLSKELCPSKMFPAEPCAFHVVKKGETGVRILARYNSPGATLFFEDLSEVPENLYILERERPPRFKNAWDYLQEGDIIVFPFLSKAVLREAWQKEVARQLSLKEATFAVWNERMHNLEKKQENLGIIVTTSIIFLTAAFLFLAAVLVVLWIRYVSSKSVSIAFVSDTPADKSQNRSGA